MSQAYLDVLVEAPGRDAVRSPLRHPRSKRAFDVVVSGLGLLAAAPVWAIVAVAVKLEDGGPVFFTQDRVGRYGELFTGWKFRSMEADSHDRFGPLQATQGDPRVTSVGRFLRATGLDELPQLWNILRGDMSFVGPRALVPEEIEVNGDGEVRPLEEVPGFDQRHAVRPGLTGLAQVYARRDITRKQKFRLDLLYIPRQSFWLDLKLFAGSVWISLRGKWEAPGPKL